MQNDRKSNKMSYLCSENIAMCYYRTLTNNMIKDEKN